MSNTISRGDLLEHIAGMGPDELSEVMDLVKVRRDQIVRERARSFSAGDTVRVTDLRKTNVWAGVHEGVIVKVNRKTANVNFPHPIHGHNVRWKVYLHHLEKVD